MREFKFRAWDKKQRKWLFNHLIHQLLVQGEDMPKEYKTRYSIMQWTGLQDKNGKDIYEGDIVRDSQRTKQKVIWCQEEQAFRLEKDKRIPLARHYEVIGNIFKNPELLKEEKK